MKQRSRKERFYIEVGDALFMNNMRSFIDRETLEVEIYPESELLDFEDEDEDEDQDEYEEIEDPVRNPDKYFPIAQLMPWQSFKIMENFSGVVQQKQLQQRLFQALEGKKPFANFKHIIDNSPERENWFTFRDDAHAEIAKEWIEKNADDELKEKIKSLSSLFII